MSLVYPVAEEKIHGNPAADPFGVPKEAHLVPLWKKGERKPVGPALLTPREVAYYVSRLEGATSERFLALLLDRRNRVLGVVMVSQGGIGDAVVHGREVFSPAVAARASAVVVAHNHPSGDPTPSEADKALTKRLVSAGAVIGIPVLDHVIVGEEASYTSLRERDEKLFDTHESNPSLPPRSEKLWKTLRARAAKIDPLLSKVALLPCAEADKEHARSKRQYAHAWHRPRVVCHAKAFSSLPIENQIGILSHELGHCYAITQRLRHTEEDANRLGSFLTGLEVKFSGPDRLERAEVPSWLA